ICGPIGCAVDFVCRLLHLKIISLKKPLQIGLCNKAVLIVDLTNMFRLNQKVKFKKSILINIKAIIKIQNKYSPLNQKNINKSPL
ncbi:hypothetical protein ACLD1C_07830, partial [Acinetobacter baumannii]